MTDTSDSDPLAAGRREHHQEILEAGGYPQRYERTHMAAELQRTFACRVIVCAPVVNILAEIPGQQPGPAVMLASHDLRWHGDPQAKAISYFLLASLASGLFASVFDQFIWIDRGALFLGAVVAMAAALHRSLPATHPPRLG